MAIKHPKKPISPIKPISSKKKEENRIVGQKKRRLYESLMKQKPRKNIHRKARKKIPSILQVKKNGVILSVGCIYSLKYIPLNAHKFSDKQRKKKLLHYYDSTPLFLVMDYRPIQGLLFGINLHFLPNDERVRLVKEVINNRDALGRQLTWRMLKKRRLFMHLPIAYRLYKLKKVANLIKVFDPGLDSHNFIGKDGQTADDKIYPLVEGNGNIHSVPDWTPSDTQKLFNLAFSNKNWYRYIKKIFKNR